MNWRVVLCRNDGSMADSEVTHTLHDVMLDLV